MITDDLVSMAFQFANRVPAKISPGPRSAQNGDINSARPIRDAKEAKAHPALQMMPPTDDGEGRQPAYFLSPIPGC